MVPVCARRVTPFGRSLYRRSLWRFVKHNWWLLLGLAGLFVLTGALQAMVADGYWLGFVHGSMVIGGIAVVLAAFWAHTGAVWQLVGAWGEDNTRDELKRAVRRHHIWGSVDGIALAGGDIDHLVAGPSGWFALDSKWHVKPMMPGMIAQDARRAARTAGKARSVLRSLRAPAPVRPVVVVWGGAERSVPPGGASMYGVDFVAGSDLTDWLGNQPSEGVMDAEQSRALLRQLQTFRSQVRPRSRPTPHKPSRRGKRDAATESRLRAREPN